MRRLFAAHRAWAAFSLETSLPRAAKQPSSFVALQQPAGCRLLATAAPASHSVTPAWYDDKSLTVSQLNAEIFRRWSAAPTPGRDALDALLQRVSTPEEAALAAEAVERFHRLRCAAGWLVGLGSRTSGYFAAACIRAGAPGVGLSLFGKGPRSGLVPTAASHRRLLAAASAGGAEATRSAYRALRGGGSLRVTPEVARLVLRGLQAGSPAAPGGPSGPAAALAAASSFASQGVAPRRRAWNALACSAAGAGDAALLSSVLSAMAAAGVAPNAVTEAVRAQGVLLAGLPGWEGAAEAALRSAEALAPQLCLPAGAGAAAVAGTLRRAVQMLPKGAPVPGGAAGLRARTLAALASANSKLPYDAEAAFQGVELTDGELLTQAATADAATAG